MKTHRNKLLAKLHILLKQTGAENHKSDIYNSFGVESAADLSDGQLLTLIDKLEGTQPRNPRIKSSELEIRAMRSEVLFVLTANPDALQPRRRGLGLPNDWQVLNPFIYEHSGKRLAAMTYEELAAFKKQLYAMRKTGWKYRTKTPIPPPIAKAPSNEPHLIVVGLPENKGGVLN